MLRTLFASLLCLGVAGCRPQGCTKPRPAIQPTGPTTRTKSTSPGGYADYHAHLFADLGFGGRLSHGHVQGPMEDALSPCGHACQGLIRREIVFSQEENRHGPDGFDAFQTWPTAKTKLHQQAHVDWLYRAYRHGLRLVVVPLVNSETLCRFAENRRDHAVCDDMYMASRQLAAIHRLVDAEQAWMGLARNATQARRIFEDNRLVVVVDIEVDTLFGCASKLSCPSIEELGNRLDAWHEAGVSQVTPVHLADNGFGGNALYSEFFTANNRVLRGEYQRPRGCADEGVEWSVRGRKGLAGAFLVNLVSTLRTGRAYRPKRRHLDPRGEPHCNERGLTTNGEWLVGALMDRGMLLALDHMSSRSVSGTLKLAEDRRYPVFLSHAWYRAMKLERGDCGADGLGFDDLKSEVHQPDEVVRRVAALGGVLGVLTNQGAIRTATCERTSSTFEAVFEHVRGVAGPKTGIGFGTDINGLAGQPPPCDSKVTPFKYGSEEVGGHVLERSKAGARTFEIGADGLAHYGMLPDFIADMQLDEEQRKVIFGGALAYIEMWERAERVAGI